jgi:DNA invertase Pin-like site-specific DNA recombinase
MDGKRREDLQAQREACEAFITSQVHEGWVCLRAGYDDGGFSGATMDRPALQRLLADIAAGRVDIVVVYKIDRLTRSLADFAKIVEILDARSASFVSVTQQFNTTTSMGRLTLNVLLSFAQFEREVISERIHDKIAASKKKGMWMGTALHRTKLPLTVWFRAAHLMSTHSNGMSARQLPDQLGLTYRTAWLLTQKLRRSMVDPDRDPLEGVVEVDQAEIPFRAGDSFFDPGNAGKILIAGAVEVIDRDPNEAKPQRKGAKYLDTRSGRVRLAMIADNFRRID